MYPIESMKTYVSYQKPGKHRYGQKSGGQALLTGGAGKPDKYTL